MTLFLFAHTNQHGVQTRILSYSHDRVYWGFRYCLFCGSYHSQSPTVLEVWIQIVFYVDMVRFSSDSTISDNHITKTFRHAMALDEHRAVSPPPFLLLIRVCELMLYVNFTEIPLVLTRLTTSTCDLLLIHEYFL